MVADIHAFVQNFDNRNLSVCFNFPIDKMLATSCVVASDSVLRLDQTPLFFAFCNGFKKRKQVADITLGLCFALLIVGVDKNIIQRTLCRV